MQFYSNLHAMSSLTGLNLEMTVTMASRCSVTTDLRWISGLASVVWFNHVRVRYIVQVSYSLLDRFM